jgi:RHS repeat-associated protein
VWRWDQQEPFGNNVPDENPSGLGVFDLPLRFPGQRYDKETNLHYNYFRDYDPSLGRYEESDPVGLRGGTNTYAYVGATPLLWFDIWGLLQWNYGSAGWNTGLQTGDPYVPYPGAPEIRLPFNAGGATSIDWWVASACVCSASGYEFREFLVDLFPTVTMRSSYPGGPHQRDWTKRSEGDHLNDLNDWQSGAGRSTALKLENQFKGKRFPTLEGCEKNTSSALEAALTSSVGDAVALSRAVHDTHRHIYSSPFRRP